MKKRKIDSLNNSQRQAAALGDVDLKKCYEASDKYECTLDTLKETLETYGVAILPKVLDEKECQHMMDEMWNYLETVTKKQIRRDDESTWKFISLLWPLHSMLIKQ